MGELFHNRLIPIVNLNDAPTNVKARGTFKINIRKVLMKSTKINIFSLILTLNSTGSSPSYLIPSVSYLSNWKEQPFHNCPTFQVPLRRALAPVHPKYRLSPCSCDSWLKPVYFYSFCICSALLNVETRLLTVFFCQSREDWAIKRCLWSRIS